LAEESILMSPPRHSQEDVISFDSSEIDKKYAIDPDDFKVEYLKDAVTIQSDQLKDLIKKLKDIR